MGVVRRKRADDSESTPATTSPQIGDFREDIDARSVLVASHTQGPLAL